MRKGGGGGGGGRESERERERERERGGGGGGGGKGEGERCCMSYPASIVLHALFTTLFRGLLWHTIQFPPFVCNWVSRLHIACTSGSGIVVSDTLVI